MHNHFGATYIALIREGSLFTLQAPMFQYKRDILKFKFLARLVGEPLGCEEKYHEYDIPLSYLLVWSAPDYLL